MISLNQVGKRFGKNWIFKGINYTFEQPGIYAILGSNGSGKSTLLRIIGGMQQLSTGRIHYNINNKEFADDKIFSQIAYCSPGMELVEEMTLKEFLEFHFSFKHIHPDYSIKKIIELLNFGKEENKLILEFSSGMKQRVKLVQAFFSNTPILLIDEPCSNLDDAGFELYHDLLTKFSTQRFVLIASNDQREYRNAASFLNVEDYRNNQS